MSAASALASGYGLKNLVALITWANVFFGIFARIINMFMLTRLSYNIRATAMAFFTLVGVLFVSFATPMGRNNDHAAFAVMLIGVILLGTASNYGESFTLTFLQRYPDTIVGAWSSGTGISGVAASLIFMGLTSAGLTEQQTFLVSTPVCIIYWLCFTVGMVAPHKVLVATRTDGKTEEIIIHCLDEDEETHIPMLREQTLARDDVVSVTEDYEIKMIMNFRGVSWRNSPAIRKPEPAKDDSEEGDGLYNPCCRFLCGCCSPTNGLRRWWREQGPDMILMHNTMLWFFFNLAVVYIAEYAAQLMAPFSFYCEPEWVDNFWVKNSYVVTQFCYQFGVLISRSSLLIVQIPYVGVLSIIQVINAICWVIQAKLLFIKSYDKKQQVNMSFILFAWMIFIGLMGGASYVNVFYLILQRSTKMRQKEEEEAVSKYLAAQGHDMGDHAAGSQHRDAAADMGAEKKLHATEPILADMAREHSDEMTQPSGGSDTGRTEPTHAQPYQLTVDNADMTDAEREEIEQIRRTLNDVWAARRETGMNIGAMYATIGITLGNLVCLVFTNTMLNYETSCKVFFLSIWQERKGSFFC
ncbi:battenin [Strigomonas culicis]|uniref:Battenin n=1 Tax=Strigomonas culicis TaxID=28005 RepID=S9TXZ5_9TRYP|nr:battenin [Strigomonas culicis]|eukprot:EPY21469.1 battenin [Strigomonas culicis]